MRVRNLWKIGLVCALFVGLAATQGAAEGDTRRAALMTEVEAAIAQAPEVRPLAEWGGKIGPAAARREIAGLLAKAGHFAEAERMAAGIARSTDRNWALGDVALSLAQDGQVLRAFKLLDAVDDAGQLSQALYDILTPKATDTVEIVLSGTEERAAALRAVKRVADLGRRLGDPERLDQAFFEAASFYLDLGETEAAKVLIDQIEGDGFQVYWVAKQIDKLVETGDFVEAERLADTISEDYANWPLAYWSLALGLAAEDRPADARRVLGHLVQPYAKVLLGTQVAVALPESYPVASGEFLAEAGKLAVGITDPEDRVEALGTVGAAFAEIGESDMAQALAAQLIAAQAGPDATSAALNSIAWAEGEAGQGEAASRLLHASERQAGLIGVAEDRASALWSVAWYRTELGQYAEAERVAADIDEAEHRVWALEKLGVALAGAGLASEAQRIAASISDTEGSNDLPGEGLDEIAEALAAMGAVDAAETVAGEIVDPAWRANAMGDVVAALAEAGQLSAAERIARRIEDPAWRAVALAAVAGGL